MSLVSTFVRCADGRWYSGLCYQDHETPARWFLCFDDEEPPELVMRRTCSMTPDEVCALLGLGVVKIRPGRQSERMFGMKFLSAKAYWLELGGAVALPTPRSWDDWDDVFTARPRGQGVYYGDGGGL